MEKLNLVLIVEMMVSCNALLNQLQTKVQVLKNVKDQMIVVTFTT